MFWMDSFFGSYFSFYQAWPFTIFSVHKAQTKLNTCKHYKYEIHSKCHPQEMSCRLIGKCFSNERFLVYMYHTAVELFGLFLPRLCARNEAPTGSKAGILGWEFNALNVATTAPCKDVKIKTV